MNLKVCKTQFQWLLARTSLRGLYPAALQEMCPDSLLCSTLQGLRVEQRPRLGDCYVCTVSQSVIVQLSCSMKTLHPDPMDYLQIAFEHLDEFSK